MESHSCFRLPSENEIWPSYPANQTAAYNGCIHFNPLTPELNPSAQRCLTRFLLWILLLEPCISLIYARKTNKHINYKFRLLITYGSSYMFLHYIAILRKSS
jgi:hypothetical protein